MAQSTEVYSEPHQISTMDVFVKIVIGCWSFLQKSYVIGFWLGSEYDSGRWAVKNICENLMTVTV